MSLLTSSSPQKSPLPGTACREVDAPVTPDPTAHRCHKAGPGQDAMRLWGAEERKSHGQRAQRAS